MNTNDLDELWAIIIGQNAEAAERYKALTPPVVPTDADALVPGSDDLDAEEAA